MLRRGCGGDVVIEGDAGARVEGVWFEGNSGMGGISTVWRCWYECDFGEDFCYSNFSLHSST